MQISLNRQNFFVNHNEFPIYNHDIYTTLKLRPKLGTYQREISFIKKLKNIFKNSIFINYGLSHGGYIPIQLINNFNHNEIFIYNINDNIHLLNFNKNKSLYDIENKIKLLYKFLSNDNIKIIKLDHKKLNDNHIQNENMIILSKKNLILNENYTKYKLKDSKLIIYVSNNIKNIFESSFKNYLSFDNYQNLFLLSYDNLLNLCIMVKDAGDGFRDILEKNLPFIDHYTILDTGSTDNTIEIAKDVLKNIDGNIYQEPFINFRDSRNRCLELAGNDYQFNIMLDDTYYMIGNVRNFLNLIRSDEIGDSYNLYINSYDVYYGSNRLLRSDRNLKYIYKIHETIQIDNNIVVQIPLDEFFIKDVESDYMFNRTKKRKNYDLQILLDEIKDNPDIPRYLYYTAQTYTELNQWQLAFDYFKKRTEHHIKGFHEEITDSYFLMAKIAYEHLSYSWDEVEKMYIKCYDYEPERPDALFMIGYHYYQEENYKKAYIYLKKAFELGFPDSRINLRVDVYNKYIPMIFTELCYKMDDYKNGLKASHKYLMYDKNNQLYISYYKIFNLLYNYSIIDTNVSYVNNKPIISFVADGGFKEWSGKTIYEDGLGGSETYIIEMARNIAKLKKYDVYVFCNCKNDNYFENVHYKNLNSYLKFIKENNIYTSIISRFSEYIPVTLKNNIQNIYFVIHDLLPSGLIIPLDEKLKGIFCLTEWHKKYFLNIFPILKDRTKYTF
jgi:hypothetical protein